MDGEYQELSWLTLQKLTCGGGGGGWRERLEDGKLSLRDIEAGSRSQLNGNLGLDETLS